MNAQRFKTLIASFLTRAEKWAIAHPGQEYRKTVIDDEGSLSLVPRWLYEETCLESEYRGEVFAIKENGKAVYSSFEAH